MKQAVILILAFICLSGLPLKAAGQINIEISAPPPIEFAGPPEVVVIPSGVDYVYMAPNAFGLYFYNGFWFRNYNGYWYRSRAYNGYWTYVDPTIVPAVILDVPPEYIYHLPPRYHRIHYGDFHRNWASWDRRRHWDNYGWYRNESRDDVRRERLSRIESGLEGNRSGRANALFQGSWPGASGTRQGSSSANGLFQGRGKTGGPGGTGAGQYGNRQGSGENANGLFQGQGKSRGPGGPGAGQYGNRQGSGSGSANGLFQGKGKSGGQQMGGGTPPSGPGAPPSGGSHPGMGSKGGQGSGGAGSRQGNGSANAALFQKPSSGGSPRQGGTGAGSGLFQNKGKQGE